MPQRTLLFKWLSRRFFWHVALLLQTSPQTTPKLGPHDPHDENGFREEPKYIELEHLNIEEIRVSTSTPLKVLKRHHY